MRPSHQIEGMEGVVAAGRRSGLPARRVAGTRNGSPVGAPSKSFASTGPIDWAEVFRCCPAPLHDLAAEHPNRLPLQAHPTPPINFVSTSNEHNVPANFENSCSARATVSNNLIFC